MAALAKISVQSQLEPDFKHFVQAELKIYRPTLVGLLKSKYHNAT